MSGVSTDRWQSYQYDSTDKLWHHDNESFCFETVQENNNSVEKVKFISSSFFEVPCFLECNNTDPITRNSYKNYINMSASSEQTQLYVHFYTKQNNQPAGIHWMETESFKQMDSSPRFSKHHIFSPDLTMCSFCNKHVKNPKFLFRQHFLRLIKTIRIIFLITLLPFFIICYVIPFVLSFYVVKGIILGLFGTLTYYLLQGAFNPLFDFMQELSDTLSSPEVVS